MNFKAWFKPHRGLVNRAAWGRGAVLVLHGFVFNRASWGLGAVLVLDGVYLFFCNRTAWGRGAALVLHGVYFFFSFVGELTKTSARPNAGRDSQSRNL